MHLTAAFWRRWQRERICGRQLILLMPWQPCLYRKSVLRPPCRSGRRLTHLWLQIVRLRIADAQTLNIGIVKAQSKLRNQRNYRQKNHSQKNHSQMDHGQKNHSQMDHSQMDHGQRNHGQRNHGQRSCRQKGCKSETSSSKASSGK